MRQQMHPFNQLTIERRRQVCYTCRRFAVKGCPAHASRELAISQCGNTGKGFPLEKFEGCATTG